MTITSQELLDTCLAQLRLLAAFLADQLNDGVAEPDAEARACRQMLCLLEVLIPTLQSGNAAPESLPRPAPDPESGGFVLNDAPRSFGGRRLRTDR